MPLVVPLSLVAVLAAVLAVLVVAQRRRAAAAAEAEARLAALVAAAESSREALHDLAAASSLGDPLRTAPADRLRPEAPDPRRPDGRRRAHSLRPPRPASDPLPPARP